VELMIRRLGAALALAVVGLTAGVLLTEGAYRLARRQVCIGKPDAPLWMPHPDVGWIHTPNAGAWLYGCIGRRFEWRVYTRINSKGLRDREYDYAKPPGVRRVLLLGDSITEAVQVPLERTFAKLLEDDLRVRGESVEVVNGGVAAFGTDTALLFFRSEGVRYDPDLVLLVFNASNDVLENSAELHAEVHERAGGYLPAKAYFRSGDDGALVLDDAALRREQTARAVPASRAWATIADNLYLVRVAQRFLGMRPALQATARRGYPPHMDVHAMPMTEPWERAWALTETLLRTLRREVEERGARFAVAVVPTREEVAMALPKRPLMPPARAGRWDFDQPTRRITSFLAHEGIPHRELRTALRAHARAAGTTGFYVFDVHLAEDGHRVVAEALRPFVAAQLAEP
jgi:hypothetical protein